MKSDKIILITGAAGFIGFHLSKLLTEKGHRVIGVDNMSDYYDVRIKQKRISILRKISGFTFVKCDIADFKNILAIAQKYNIGEVVHLAAQAGVRYSIDNPWAYAHSNYLGTLNMFEVARSLKLPRVIYASSSSVYGLNSKQPFSECDRTDTPISTYAATKRANELLAHAYSHLFDIETVGLRFFTVYGDWSRPDMALFKFAKNIVLNKPIDLYNKGKMKRSFTHVDDVCNAIATLINKRPHNGSKIYNLGGANAVSLEEFVNIIEKFIGKKAKRKLLKLQAGDVPETIADCSLAGEELGYKPSIDISDGIEQFVKWFINNKDFLCSLQDPKQ